jgi:hypothetical protein
MRGFAFFAVFQALRGTQPQQTKLTNICPKAHRQLPGSGVTTSSIHQHSQLKHRRHQAAASVAVNSSTNGSSSSSSTVPVSIIATDVDGTLLNSQQQLTPGVEAAVRAAADAGVPVSNQ